MKTKTKRMLHIAWASIAIVTAAFIVVLYTDTNRKGAMPKPGTEEYAKLNEGGFIIDMDPNQQLAFYKEWAKYPPYSRPLGLDQTDLLSPNQANEPAIPVVQEQAEGCPTDPKSRTPCSKPPRISDISCSLSMDKRLSVGVEDQKLFVECHRTVEDRLERLPIEITQVVTVNQTTKQRLASPIFQGDDGSNGDAVANDRIYTVVLRPGKQDWGWMNVGVSITVQKLSQALTTAWFSSPRIVAEFKPGMSDFIQEGHLHISVPVVVHKAGYYLFQANLLEQGGDHTPIATSDWKGNLEAGVHLVPMVFFGKIIRDRDVNGPFVMQNLRGHRLNLPVVPGELSALMRTGGIPKNLKQDEPEFEYLPVAAEHVTRYYSAHDFSDQEWTSPEKDDRIRFLREMAQKDPD
ncbi:MAG: hypothetical protein K8S54_03900 [Spirochaetia bacterium]|nr:hypothetical protein [Spirochaetia bacterium]